MESEPPRVDPPKRKRRWFQFSLRAMMISTVVCAIAAGWLGGKIERKRKERDAVAALKASGAFVSYDYLHNVDMAEPPGPAWLRSLLGDNFFAEVEVVSFGSGGYDAGDDVLDQVRQFRHLRMLDLSGTKISDAAIERIEDLKELLNLDVSFTPIGSAGIDRLKGLTQLRGLWLESAKITDADLVNLRGLTALENLNLGNTDVTDAGLANIRGFSQLRTLILRGANVSDDGLLQLKGLAHLENLDVRSTRISAAGVKDFQRAVPACGVVH